MIGWRIYDPRSVEKLSLVVDNNYLYRDADNNYLYRDVNNNYLYRDADNNYLYRDAHNNYLYRDVNKYENPHWFICP